MSAQNCPGAGGDLCMTMVELSLAQLNPSIYDSGRGDDEIAGGGGVGGFRDRRHGDVGIGDGRLLDLEVPSTPGNYVPGHTPLVTQSVPYVTQLNAASGPDFIPTSSVLDFHLDRLSSFQRDRSASEARSTDPVTALSVSASGERPLLDRVRDMSYSVVCADTCDQIAAAGRRKKAVPRRHEQPAGSKPDTMLPSPDTGPKQLMDDYTRLVKYVPQCLERFGFCVVDKFAGKHLAMSVRNEVLAMYNRGLFEDGLLTSQAFAVTAVRGDRVFWLEREDDEQCAGICKLICRLDDLFLRLRGCLGSCHISSRSKAMLACYPGQGRCYRRHVDNPNQDGRAITALYYINKAWDSQRDGGVLRMYPSQLPHSSVDVEPVFDRILLFWSDSRTPHEVQPAYRNRYGVTVWYFNDVERQQARQRYALQGGHVENPRLASVALLTKS